MAERLFPTEDPVREAVLQWTVNRDAADVRRLLTWLPEARSSKEREVLMPVSYTHLTLPTILLV